MPNVEVGVLVGASFAAEGRVVLPELPGGHVAATLLRDGHAGLPGAHEAVHRFAASSALELAGPQWDLRPPAAGRGRPRVGISYLLR